MRRNRAGSGVQQQELEDLNSKMASGQRTEVASAMLKTHSISEHGSIEKNWEKDLHFRRCGKKGKDRQK